MRGRLVLLLLAVILLVALSFAIFHEEDPEYHFCGNGPQQELDITVPEGGVNLTQESTNGALVSNKIRAVEAVPGGWLIGYAQELATVRTNLVYLTTSSIEACQDQRQGIIRQILGHINDILYDDGVIWVATDGDGVYRYADQRWYGYIVNQGLNDVRTYDIFKGVDGKVYAATWEGVSVYHPETDQWLEVVTVSDPAWPQHFHSILKVGDEWWLGSINDGLYRASPVGDIAYRAAEIVGWPGQVEVVPELGTNNIRVVRAWEGERILVGGDAGFALYESTVNTWETLPDAPQILGIEFASNGQVWVTGSTGTFTLAFPYSGGISLVPQGPAGLSLALGIGGETENQFVIGTDGNGLFWSQMPVLVPGQ